MNPSSGQDRWPALKYRWLIWLVYLLAWTVGLLMPMSAEADWPSVGGIGLKFLFAKTLHVAAYAVLTMLSGWLLVPARFRWLLVYFLAVHATGTELLQLFVPGRTGRLQDVGLDLSGVTLGVLLTWKWWCEPS